MYPPSHTILAGRAGAFVLPPCRTTNYPKEQPELAWPAFPNESSPLHSLFLPWPLEERCFLTLMTGHAKLGEYAGAREVFVDMLAKDRQVMAESAHVFPHHLNVEGSHPRK